MGNSIFDAIALEIERGDIDKGLWTEAFATANGDQNVTKARYIQFRARQLGHSAERPFSAADFGTAFRWFFAVGFCGFAGSGVFGSILLLFLQRFIELLQIQPVKASPYFYSSIRLRANIKCEDQTLLALPELYFNRMLRFTGIRKYELQVSKILKETTPERDQALLVEQAL